MKNILQEIWVRVAIFYGKNISLDKKFRKENAVAIIHFIDGKEGNIKINMNGITYFFEGEPEKEEYKNALGKNVVKKTLKYGGWEIDLTHHSHSLFRNK